MPADPRADEWMTSWTIRLTVLQQMCAEVVRWPTTVSRRMRVGRFDVIESRWPAAPYSEAGRWPANRSVEKAG
jgi:hypothetical protein